MDSRFSAANSFMRVTRSVSFASVDSILLPLPVRTSALGRQPLYTQTASNKLRLPTAAGAAASAAAATKTAEASSTAAGTAPESTSAQHAANHGANPPAAASSSAPGRVSNGCAEYANDDEDDDQNRPDGERPRIVFARPNWPGRRRCAKCHTSIVGDVFDELPGASFDASAV